jgi:hypothetical protein
MKTKDDGRMELLLAFIDQAFDGRAWHGPTLRGSLRRVTPEEALWRPTPEHHNIWELALHAAYWKYVIRRKLTGAKKGSFTRTGSNWFRRDGDYGIKEWKKDLALLESEHRQLRELISSLDLNKAKRLDMLLGSASHDLYHAGQIQLLKRLQRGGAFKPAR